MQALRPHLFYQAVVVRRPQPAPLPSIAVAGHRLGRGEAAERIPDMSEALMTVRVRSRMPPLARRSSNNGFA